MPLSPNLPKLHPQLIIVFTHRYAEIAVEDLVRLISSGMAADVVASEVYQADIADLRMSFVNQLSHAVVKCIRTSLDHLKRNSSSRVGFDEESSRVAKTPIFKSFVVLGEKTVSVEVKKGDKTEHVTQTEKVIETRPTLSEIQETVTTVADRIVRVANAILTWGQDRHNADKSAIKTHYDLAKSNKEVQRIVDSLSTIVNQTLGDMVEHQESFNVFSELWTKDRETAMAEFLTTKPTLWAFEEEVEKYEEIEQRVKRVAPAIPCGAIILDTGKITDSLLDEIKAWKDALGASLNSKSSTDLDDILSFAQGIVSRLERPINDLEDVRLAMECLKEMRDNEIKFDAMMGPIEQGYAMLTANNVKIPSAEQEKLDSLTFTWTKMSAASKETTNKLVEVQPLFRDTLSSSIETFQKDQAGFTSDYTIKGPMQNGIKPQEANERLQIFQTRFDELWKRYITFSAGEEIFGLPKTEYLDLVRIKKELNLLSKLYGLYDDVIKGVSGFYDIKWVDVDSEAINMQLLDFSNRTKKLPKALKEWDAYLELEKTIDNFTEVLPLLESMANPSVLPRHWKRMEDACGGYAFDVTNPLFELRGLMEGPIFENKEDLEDICIGAVKEQDIEAKLKAVIKDWSSHVVTFATFKSRGELLVKGADMSELVAVMEDSLMVRSLSPMLMLFPFARASLPCSLLELGFHTDTIFKFSRCSPVSCPTDTTLRSKLRSRHGFEIFPTRPRFWRSGWSCKTCGCTLKPSLSAVILPSSCRRRPSASPTLTRAGRRSCSVRTRTSTSSSAASVTTQWRPSFRTCSSSSKCAKSRLLVTSRKSGSSFRGSSSFLTRCSSKFWGRPRTRTQSRIISRRFSTMCTTSRSTRRCMIRFSPFTRRRVRMCR